MIYIITFILSSLVFEAGIKIHDNKIRKIVYTIALLLPVILSMYRGDSVGRDVMGYAKPTFQMAKAYSGFGNFIGYDGMEPAYLLLEYIGAHVFNSFPFVLGVTQLIIDYCVYKAVMIVGFERYLPFCMYTFYTLYFGGSLNIMRQNTAAALILLAFAYLFKQGYIQFAICFILAVCFHTTAGLAVIFLWIYYVADKKKLYNVTNFVIILSGLVMSVFWESVFKKIFSYIPIWQKNYADYFIYGKLGDTNETLILCGLLAIVIMIINIQNNDSKWYKLLLSMSIGLVAYAPISQRMDVMGRLLLYPNYFLILVYPLLENCVKIKINGVKVCKLLNVGLMVVFTFIWYYVVVVNNSNSIMPYKFMGQL